MISAVRFFAVAPLHSRHMIAAMAAVLISGVAMLLVDASRGGDAATPLILLQTLAASSGYAVSARRGHLDLLLTAGAGRVSIALVHLGASVLPGLCAWLALGIVEAALVPTMRPAAFASGTTVAMGAVSVVAWALTVRLPRTSGGIAWLLAIVVWVVGWSGGQTVLALAAEVRSDLLTRAALFILCPFLLIGRRLETRDLLPVAPSIGLAVLLGSAAVLWIVRADVPLESAQ